MIDNKILALDIASKIPYELMDDRILVKPLKPVQVTKLVPTAPVKPAASLDGAEQSEATEPTKQRVDANIRKGIILKLGPAYTKLNEEGTAVANPDNLQVGDIVLYPAFAGFAFELFKDTRLFRRYELVGRESTSTDAV